MVGTADGKVLGTEKGALLGLILGTDDGGTECTAEGTADGTVLGTTLGDILGVKLVATLGLNDGPDDGSVDNDTLGTPLAKGLGKLLDTNDGMLLGEILPNKLGTELGVVDGDAQVGNIKFTERVNAMLSNTNTSASKAVEIVSSSRMENVLVYPSVPGVKRAVSPDDESNMLKFNPSEKTGLEQSLSVTSADSLPPTKKSILKQNVFIPSVKGVL